MKKVLNVFSYWHTTERRTESAVQVNFGSVEDMNITGIQIYPLRPVNVNMHQLFREVKLTLYLR